MSLYNQTKKFFNNKKNKFITGIALGVVLAAGVFGFGAWNLNQSQPSQAQAADITVSPGGNVRISFWYGNETDEDEGNTLGNLEVRIGTYLQVQKMYDVFDTNGDGNFDNETMYEVCTSYLTNLPPTNPNASRKRMFYIPRTANNTNGCSGDVVDSATDLQSVALPLGNRSTRENFGRLIVEAKLDPNILDYINDATGQNYKIGDVLAPDLNFQGASAIFRTRVGDRPINTSDASFSLKIGDILIIPVSPENLLPGGLIEGQDFATATNLTCESPFQVDTNTDCSGTLPEGFTAPTTGDLTLNLEGQDPVVCTFAENNIDFTCENMPAGPNEGTLSVQSSVDGSTPTNTGETVEVVGQPIGSENLAPGGMVPGQTFAEATGLECQDGVVVNGTTTCSGTLPEGHTAPEGGNLELNVEGQDPIVCVFDANGKDFICENMPVGINEGEFPVQSSVDGSTPTDTGETVEVGGQPITSENLAPGGLVPGQDFATATNLTCQSPVQVNTSTDCSGTLPEGFTAPEGENLRLNLEGQNPVVCTFATNGIDFTCENMATGPNVATLPVQSSVNNSSQINTGKTVDAVDTDGILHLFPMTAIQFSPTKQEPAIYGEEDLTITLNHDIEIAECTIWVRQYGTENEWVNLNGQMNGNNCTATLPKAAQNTPRWDFYLRITDTEGYKWGGNPSYFMYYGAISLVEISACNVDEC